MQVIYRYTEDECGIVINRVCKESEVDYYHEKNGNAEKMELGEFVGEFGFDPVQKIVQFFKVEFHNEVTLSINVNQDVTYVPLIKIGDTFQIDDMPVLLKWCADFKGDMTVEKIMKEIRYYLKDSQPDEVKEFFISA